MQSFLFRFVQIIYISERAVTVFTDVQLFEVNQAGDGGWQVGQVIIRHAQLLQGLAVEELLWEHGGETMEYYSVLVKSDRLLVEWHKRTQRESQCCGKAVPFKQ